MLGSGTDTDLSANAPGALTVMPKLSPQIVKSPMSTVPSPEKSPSWNVVPVLTLSPQTVKSPMSTTPTIATVGLHLKSKRGGTPSHARREAQAKIVQRVIEKEIIPRGYLPIVLGDLNEEDPDVPDRDNSKPDSRAVSLIKEYDPDTAGPELVNAARLISRQRDRYTHHWDNKQYNGVPDPGEPLTMLDHVLLHRDLMPLVQRVFIDHSHGARLSDHWPVVVDLEVN